MSELYGSELYLNKAVNINNNINIMTNSSLMDVV